MRTLKRILASLMVAVMVLTAAPLSGFVGLELPDFSGLFSTKAEAATDPYYSKYGVTYNQLFRLYPSYLSPKGEIVLVNRAVETYTDVIESYNSYDDFVGSYLYSLKEGVSILSTTILSSFGLTKSYEEKFRFNSVQSLMQEVQSYNSILTAIEEQVDDAFGNLDDSYNLTTAAGKIALIADLKENCTMLNDANIEEVVNGVFENADDFMSDLGKVADLAEVTISVVCLYAMETTLIAELRDSLGSGSALKEDLGLLLNDLNRDPVSHILEHYLNDYMKDLYVKAVSSAIANAANSGTTYGATIAGAVVSTVFKLAADHLYIWALGDEIAQTIFLSTYSKDLDMAVQEMRKAFQLKTAKTDEDISKYKLLYSAYLRSVKVTLESALIMAKNSDDKNRVKEWISVINTFTYDDYIDFCMTQLKLDIDAGKVKKPSSMNEGEEPSTATQEESRISIQEKFKQLKEAYPPNHGVTFFQSYGGAIQCFGFARFAFNKIFDCDMPAAYKNEKRYEYVNNQNVVLLGQLSGAGAVTEVNVKELLSQALVGDIIQACGASQHTMMVQEVTNEYVAVYECNWNGDCVVHERKITFADFAAAYSQPHSVSESGVSLYRAANYDSLYWDGTAVFYDDSVNFVIEDGVLVKYNGWQQYVLIPEEVTAIGDQAFYNNDRIIGVTMMDNVVSIGEESFKDCDNLYFCQLSNTLESIGYGAFNSCNNLSSAHLPDTLTSLGAYSYYDCSSLSSVELSSSLEEIYYHTFSHCTSLTNIDIPDSVTIIGFCAFEYCTSLKNVTLSNLLTEMGYATFAFTAIESIEIPKSLDICNSQYNYSYSFDDKTYSIPQGPFLGCEKLKEVTFEKGTEQIAQSLFAGCVGLDSIIIPDTVTSIENNAFNGCLRLSSVDISDCATSIDYWAFYRCISLPEVIVPDSVTIIGNCAFEYCTSLKDVTLSKSLTEIETAAFAFTAIESVEIPKSLDNCHSIYYDNYTFNDKQYSIPQGPFLGCEKLKEVTFENGTTQVAQSLFAGCVGLEEIVIPDTVTVIENNAFNGCLRLSSVDISDCATSIDYWAFYRCISLPEVIIPDSVTIIGNCAFEYCTSLKDVTLSKSLTEMGYAVFAFTTIESVEIPKSLDICNSQYNYSYSFDDKTYSIPQGPFLGCEKLKEVTFENGTTQVAQSLFAGCVGLEEIVIPDTVMVIENNAFNGCVRLQTAYLSKSITSIDNYAFENCVSLIELELPDEVTTLGAYAFYNCDSLIEVVIPDSVTTLNYYYYTFAYCDKLMNVTLSESLKSIPDRAFIGCTALKTIKIPDAIESIGAEAFGGCTSLESFEYSENTKLKTISNNAFYGCNSLKEAILPETVTSVGSYAFQNCTALEKVYIPQSTKTIGSQIFKGCEMLSDVTFADYSISEIPSQAFMDCPSLTEIVFPKGLKKIGSQAFVNDTSLFNLTISMSVTSIDSTAFSYPAKTTIFGVAGTYAETFADNGGFNFTDISAPCEGIILVDEVEYVILDVGETFRAVFEYWPEEHTDIVTLTASNTNVTINGMDVYARYTGDTVITATTSSGCTYEFNVHIRNPKSISITTQPDKLEYITGEDLDLTGMVVQVLYNDNSTKEVSNYTVSGFDSSAEGTYTVTVKWVSAANSTYSTSFKVTVIDPAPELTGIEVTKLPDKTTYAKRESFDPTGMVVSGLYSDGSTAEVTGYKVTGYNALKTGVQTLTVTYEGFTARFTVTVGASCTHTATEIRNALVATCTTAGYTGDTYCTSCNTLVASGMEIPAVLQGCIASGDKLCGLTSGMSTDEFVEKYFNSDTSEIEFDSSVVATGIVVTVTHQNGDSESFEILLFGDVNGDSWYDGQDAIIVDCLANGMLTKDDVSEAVYMAADCNHDGVIDQLDVDLLNQAGTLLSNVDQSKPAEVLLETSAEYAEYISLIDQSPELDIEDETDAPEVDVETEETPEQDANKETNFFEMIMEFIKSIFEMLFAYIPMPL
jgi:hypothetical protein